MPSQEEREMMMLVLVMVSLLGALLAIPSGSFVGGIRFIGEAARSLLPGGTTSSSTTSSTATSSTAEPTTSSTTTSSSTTSTSQPTTTTAASQTASSAPTPTTLGGRGCGSDEDCPTLVQLMCKGNSVWNYTTFFRCVDDGSGHPTCMGKPRGIVVEKCEEYQNCLLGACVNTYGNECDYECNRRGYEAYYCRSGACGSSDENVPISGACSDNEGNCCCTGR